MNSPTTAGSGAVGARRDPSIGERALAGEAAAVRADLIKDITTAHRAWSAYFSATYSSSGRRMSLAEEASLLNQVPAAVVFEKLANELEDVMAEPPHDQRNRILVGLMVDAFPNGRPERLGTYQDALAFDLLDTGAPPSVVAQGLRDVRRGKVFLPAVSEVLETVNTLLSQRRAMIRTLRSDADRRLLWADDLETRRAEATVPAERARRALA